MVIRYHPEGEILARYAAGTLGESASVLVATHLALCPCCREDVEHMEALGGTLLEDLVPTSLAPSALASALARLDDEESPDAVSHRASLPLDEGARNLPEPLRGFLGGRLDTLPWRRLGPGVFQHVVRPDTDGAKTRLIRVAPGKAMPRHGHTGTELTLVLSGAFFDGSERFARGDVEHADSDVVHRPLIDRGSDCICFLVTDAPLRFSSFFGRLAQRVSGF